jgi:acyl-coenzyme A thioesterase PaaI-like protein
MDEKTKVCGGCRATGVCGLGVVREHHEGERALFRATCPPDRQGGPKVAHGGWTAAAFDECLGSLPNRATGLAVTAELTVRYLKPVPVGRTLEVRVELDRREGSRWYVSGEMLLRGSADVLARASGVWVARDSGHFDRHENWLAGQDAAARLAH